MTRSECHDVCDSRSISQMAYKFTFSPHTHRLYSSSKTRSAVIGLHGTTRIKGHLNVNLIRGGILQVGTWNWYNCPPESSKGGHESLLDALCIDSVRLSVCPAVCRLRYCWFPLQQCVTQRNAKQEFLRNKKCCTVLFYATADVATAIAASCGALRKQIETSSIFVRNAGRPEAKST